MITHIENKKLLRRNPEPTSNFCVADLPQTQQELEELFIQISSEIARAVNLIAKNKDIEIEEFRIWWLNIPHKRGNPDVNIGHFEIDATGYLK